jgi:hypothetical protein
MAGTDAPIRRLGDARMSTSGRPRDVWRLRCLVLATPLTMALAAPGVAQSGVQRAGGAEFSGLKTYWAEKREGCQPMIAFNIKNASSGAIGPIELRMEVVDKDTKSVFAGGAASVPSTGLPPGQIKEIAIGGDHDIAAHDCLGDMHEMAFSNIHFTVRLTATVGQDRMSVDVARDAPMTQERVPAQD